jgi:hypothetical protein
MFLEDGTFETAPGILTPGTTAQLDGSLLMEFVCQVAELVERIKKGAILVADIIHVTDENYEELLGKAQVPLSPLLSETWVQGLAKIWAPGSVPRTVTHFFEPCQIM